MKKNLTIFLAFLIYITSILGVAADNDITVKIGEQPIVFDVPPQIINNRTMVPMRKIFETLGATVEWNPSTKTIKAEKAHTTITLTIDDPKMSVNDNIVTLDVPACLVNNRTFVPIRAIAEAFKTEVSWDETTKTVSISSESNTPFDILKQYILEHGQKLFKEIYSVELHVRPGTMSYNPDEDVVLFTYTNGGYITTLTLSKTKRPQIYISAKGKSVTDPSKEYAYTMYGTYYSDSLTTDSFENDGTPFTANMVSAGVNYTYMDWDAELKELGIDVEIRDFGIYYETYDWRHEKG